MKKLMTMIAAVAMSFGLFAANTFSNSVDWVSAADQNPYVTNDTLWAYTAGNVATNILENEVQVKDHALVLKTGSKVLARKFAATAPAIGEGLYADMVLDLNGEALDEVPEVDGAKIALFALDGTDIEGLPNGTNVYVYAAYGTEGKALFQLMNGAADFVGSARRITVKAYENVLAAGSRPGFLVFIDADGESITESKIAKVQKFYTFQNGAWAEGSSGDYLGGLSIAGACSKWTQGSQKSLFVSMDTDPDTGDCLASVDFKGNGAITSITLTDTDPGFPADNATMTIEATDATVKAVEGNGAQLIGTTISMPVANVVTATVETTKGNITITGANATKVAEGKYEFMLEDKDTLTVKGWDAAATVDGEAYEDIDYAIAAAITKATTATDPVAFVLGKSIESGANLVFDPKNDLNTAIVLDLAGKTLVSTSNKQPVIKIGAKGVLMIIDSDNEGKGTVSNAEYGAIDNAGSLIIEAGTFIGEVYVEEDAEISITGGSFDKVSNTDEQDENKFALADAVANGYTYNGTDKDGYWTVKEADKGTVIFICEATGLNETNKNLTVGDEITFPTDLGKIYMAGKGWYKEATFVNPADTTVQEGENTYYAKAEVAFAGEGTEGAPYAIATVDDLKALDAFTRDGLAVGVYFQQTVNIDLTGKTFNGIGARNSTYKYQAQTAINNATDIFRGVYDGNKKTISNLTGDSSEGAKYGGVFNTIQNATIKDLTVENIAISDETKKDSAYAIVGVAYDSTLEGLTVKGAIKANCNYGPIATVADKVMFKNCTNEATITNLCTDHLAQGGMVAYGIAVTFDTCVSKGTLIAPAQHNSSGSTSRQGGIIAADCNPSSDKYITFIDCDVTQCTLTANTEAGSDPMYTGSFIGHLQDSCTGIVVQATNVAPADKLTIGLVKDNAKADSAALSFATVNDNVATIAALAKDTTFKVIAPDAKPTFELQAAGDAISFNTNFCEVASFDGITAAIGLEVEPSEAAGIVTFTAKAVSTDPIPVIDPAQPGAAEKIAEVTAKFVNDPAVANNVGVENYTVFQAWAEKCTSGQAAVVASSDAFLSFALNAADVPAEAITDDDVTIDSYDAATGKITVSIEGIVPGAAVPAGELAKVLTAIGGEALDAMDTAKVAASGVGVASGVIEVTVTPKAENPAAFFTQIKLVK